MDKITLRAFKDMCSRENLSLFILASVNQTRFLGNLQYSLYFSECTVMPESNMILFKNKENSYVVFNDVSKVCVIEEIPGFGIVFTIECSSKDGLSSEERCYTLVTR